MLTCTPSPTGDALIGLIDGLEQAVAGETVAGDQVSRAKEEEGGGRGRGRQGATDRERERGKARTTGIELPVSYIYNLHHVLWK